MKIELIHGDCLEVLKTIPDKSIDLILQDPPYNTTDCEWEWDIMTKIDEFWAEWKRVIKDNGAIVMTASQPFTSKLVMSNLKWFKYEWIWNKNNASNFQLVKYQPLKYHENIIVFSKNTCKYNPQGIEKCEIVLSNKNKAGKLGHLSSENKRTHYIQKIRNYPRSILNFNRQPGFHPTQKPVALMEYLIKTYTNEGDTVFDGFMGSGTTGVACKKLNRNFIGVELDEKYYKIAKERINSVPDDLFTA